MFGSVFSKTLFDKRNFLIGWALGIGVMFAFIMSFYTSMDMSGLGSMMKSMPKGVESVVGEMVAYGTIPGYIGNAIYGIRFEMLAVPMVLVLAISLSASEERSRKLYQLLAQPVSRRRVMWQKWLAGVVILTVIMAIAGTAILATLQLMNLEVPFETLGRETAMALFFVVSMFTLALGLGFATGSRSLPTFVIIALVLGGYIIKGFAAQVEWVDVLSPASIYTYYDAPRLVSENPALIDIAMLGGIVLFGLILMNMTFPYRDLKEEQ